LLKIATGKLEKTTGERLAAIDEKNKKWTPRELRTYFAHTSRWMLQFYRSRYTRSSYWDCRD